MQSNQGLPWPLSKSAYTVKYIDEQRRTWSFLCNSTTVTIRCAASSEKVPSNMCIQVILHFLRVSSGPFIHSVVSSHSVSGHCMPWSEHGCTGWSGSSDRSYPRTRSCMIWPRLSLIHMWACVAFYVLYLYKGGNFCNFLFTKTLLKKGSALSSEAKTLLPNLAILSPFREDPFYCPCFTVHQTLSEKGCTSLHTKPLYCTLHPIRKEVHTIASENGSPQTLLSRGANSVLLSQQFW